MGDKIKVFEAFAGYGSQSIALRNIGVDYEVVAISEIDKYAIHAYEAIHGQVNNLGDISKINYQNEINIVYEDNNILVVNKPKGILIHGDKGEKRKTLANSVLSYLYKKGEFKNDGTSFIPSPTHRLDRNTSGLVVFAKNVLASQEMMNLFKTHEAIKKTYLLLAFNSTKNKEGEISFPLIKDSKNGFVSVGKLEEGAKEARTLYKVIDENDNYSLIEATLITGRTHQLRVHFKEINLPIVGDEKYGDFAKNKIFEDKYQYRTQFLIAYKLSFGEVHGELSYLSNRSFKGTLSQKEAKILKELGLNVKK